MIGNQVNCLKTASFNTYTVKAVRTENVYLRQRLRMADIVNYELLFIHCVAASSEVLRAKQ